MGKPRVSSADKAKDREASWKNMFKSLLDMIKKQQRQIESFVKERKSLEKRIKSQHERWAFDVKLLQDHISLMRRDMKVKDMARFVDTAKANMLISMKQKEAKVNKRKFEDVDDERADLKILFEEVTKALAEPQRVTRSNRKELLDSALKAERDFAWNQYEKKDHEFQEVVNKNRKELGAANDKVANLMSALEKSEFSNIEKDKTVSALREDLSVLESESRKKSEEISRLNKELEFLRGGGSRSITPVLQRCMVTSSKNRGHSTDITITNQERRGSKRKATDTTILFNSTLKVPKLKN